MRAVLYRKFGGPEVLEPIQDHPSPRRKSGEVLIKVHCAGCNPVDYKFRNGSIPIAPYNKVSARHDSWACRTLGSPLRRRACPARLQILGVDVAGTVEAADEGAKVRPVCCSRP